MVDVHPRILAPTRGHVLEEGSQRRPLLRSVVGPERCERAACVEYAEEILETPVRSALGPQRVTLEVEEHISRVRLRNAAQRSGIDDLVFGHTAHRLRYLQSRLRSEVSEYAGRDTLDGSVERGELSHGGDAGVDEMCSVASADAGDEEQVLAGDDLLLARIAPPASGVPGVGPVDGFGVGDMLVDDLLEVGSLATVDREQVLGCVVGGGAVAEHQVQVPGHLDAVGFERIRIRGQLQQGRYSGVPRQLRVVHGVRGVVRPSAFLDQEVAEPEEAAVEERGLIQHVVLPQRGFDGGGIGVGQTEERALGPGHDRDTRSEPALEQVELTAFVREAERRGAFEHGVCGVVNGVDSAELCIEGAKQRVLARRGGREVAGAVNDAVGQEEHAPNCR